MSKNLSKKERPQKKNKERLQQKLVKNIKIFLRKKKKKNVCEHYKNLTEDEKDKLVKYRKDIKWEKNTFL